MITNLVRRRLSAKLAAGYLLVSLLVIGAAGMVAFDDASDALTESAFDRLEAEADRKQAAIDLWVGDQVTSVRSLVSGDDVRRTALAVADPAGSQVDRQAAAAALTAMLRRGLSVNRNLAELAFLGNPGGEVLASTDPSTIGNFRTQDRYFAEGREGVVVVGVYQRADLVEPAMTIGLPIADEAGRTAGVVAAHLSLDVLQETVSAHSQLGATGETYIVDRFNNFASRARFGVLQLPRGAHSQGIDAAVLDQRSGRGTYDNYVGTNVLGVYRWLDGYDVALVAEIGRDEATAPARALAERILVVSALAVGFLAVAVALVARRATRPILALERAATRVAGDELDVELPVTTQDEIGSLAASFNLMTTRLRESRGEMRAANVAIARAELRSRTILETALDAVVTIDAGGRVTGWNHQAEAMFGWTADEVLRDPPPSLPVVERLLALQVDAPRERWARRLEMVAERRDGRSVPVEVAVTCVTIDGAPVLCAFIRDVTARKQIERQLAYQALHDSLTGLPNRTLLLERIEHAIARAQREPSAQFAVLFCDLDRFKVINDSLGHSAGDELLAAVSNHLAEHVRGVDTVARLGGDEFGILLESITDVETQVATAHRLVEELSRPFAVAGQTIHITASVGMVASSTRTYGEAQEMLRDADLAMYRAKAAGGGRVVQFTTSMHATAVALQRLEQDLRDAVQRDELRLYFQPVFAVSTLAVAGYEALVRWQHPTRGLLCPNAFVDHAEDSGLITAVGERVLELACAQLEDLLLEPRAGCPPVISVNLSRRQLDDPVIVDRLARLVAVHRIPPRALRLEITETAAMRDLNAGAGLLQQIAALGVDLHIDDFGTGYSSLAALHELPVTTLKIDRSFIHDADFNGTSAATVRTMVTLARTLGLDVIAEGVETSSQLRFLQELDCDFAQGYLLCHPMPPAEAFAYGSTITSSPGRTTPSSITSA